MTRFSMALLAACVALGACSMSEDAAVAEQAVPTFHEQMNAGRFDAIYAGAADDLKKTVSQHDFVELLAAVHRKLGNVTASDKTGWNINYQPTGRFVTLGYKTSFEGGGAQEQFVFRLQDK